MFNSYLFNDALFNDGAGAVVTSAAQQNLLYIFNSSEELTAIIPAADYFDAKHYEKLNGDNTFKFKIVNPNYMPYLTVGSLVAFIDLDGYWQFFELKQVTDTHKNTFEKQVYCQHCLYELIDDIVTDVRPSTTALAAMTSVLANTRWNVGIVDDLGTASCNVYYESALAGVQKVAEAWGGELRWRCLILGGVITRYVDLLLQRGADTGKTFSYDKDIEEINREIDLTDVCTAMYGRGKGVETDTGGYGRRLTFEDEVWTVAGGDPADKPADQEWVGDTTALALYGRPGGRHRYGVYTNDQQTDAATLLQETWDYLQTMNTPRATYQLKAIVLEMLSGYAHEAVRLGDTVRVIDEAFTPELRMSARVIELERDILDPRSSAVTVGNFAPSIVEVTYNVQKQIRDVKNSTYNTKWLDGTISVLQNEINNTQSYVFQTPGDGILIMDAATFASATKAMKIGGGIFALANSKTGDQWNWRTFGTGAGFTADEITTGLLDAALVQVGAGTTFDTGYDPSDKIDAPGYVTAESTGFSVYDNDDNLRALLGSWIRNSVREYGLKVIGGLIMTSDSSDRIEINDEGLFGFYDDVERIRIDADNIGYIQFKDSSGVYSGYIGASDSQIVVVGLTPNKDMDVSIVAGQGKKISLTAAGGVTCTGNLSVTGNLSCTGSKPAQQVTENYGLRYMYATEAPELVYYDRGAVNLINGEATVRLDPIYLECIEPDTELTPWQIWCQCYGENDVYISEIGSDYFKIKERNGGTSANKVVWKHEAIRNGYAGIRLMEVLN